MKKNLTRILSLLLVLVLMVGVLPVSALADGWDLTGELDTEQLLERAEPVEMQASEEDTSVMRIFHLDCGRKYFSVDEIKEIIDWLSANHYTHIELAIGNDGMRFLLDDMSVTVGEKTYSHDDVKNAIQTGNKIYYDAGSANELTEAEMNTIISYAANKGISVIPLLNSPGHMDAILYASKTLVDKNSAYWSSARTIDVTNAKAVEFTQAFIQKYITYFAQHGCAYFNIGADEYANDKTNGFSALITAGKYGKFIEYVNGIADMIDKAGMTPMAFNDGIYYNSKTNYGTFYEKIVVCYWTAGYSGYYPASASFIASKGHKLINTNDGWYYVLGRYSGTYPLSHAQNGVKNTKYNTLPGGSSSESIGCMQCLWCDEPYASYNDTEKANVKGLIDTFAANNAEVFKSTVPFIEPFSSEPLKVGGTLALSIKNAKNAAATTWSVSAANVVSLSSTTGETVTLTAHEAGQSTVTANADGKDYTYDVTVVDPDAPKTETVTLTVGQEAKRTQDGVNNSGADKIDKSNYNANIASVSVTGTDANQEPAKYTLTNVAYSKLTGSNRTWTKTAYFYRHTDNNYYPIYGKVDYIYYYYGYSLTDSANSVSQLGKSWTDDSVAVYAQTPAVDTPASTTITFKGLAVGETSIKVGNVTYLIEVVDKAPDNALTGNLRLEYWITNYPVYTDIEKTAQSQTISTSAEGASTDEGIAISALAPNSAYSFFDGTKTVYYWMTVRLDSAHKQTSESGVDQTAAGTTLTHVRYHANAWQYKTLDGTWTYFESGDQLVAYYLQKTTVTKDVETYVKDWGYGTDTTTPNHSEGKGQVALTIAVVYPDGTVQPTEDNMYSQATTIFNYWTDRDIGIVSPKVNNNYTISKMTITDGKRKSNTSANVWYTSDTITWDKVELESGAEWYNETVVWQKSDGTTPMVNASDEKIKAKCTWSEKNTAKLVLIYLEPIQKDTNLNVVYVDRDGNVEIQRMQVAMKYNQGDPAPTYFTHLYDGNNLIASNNKTDWPGKTKTEPDYLPDSAYVVNAGGVSQTFSKDITTNVGIADKYKSGLYRYDGAEISTDGKTLTLYFALDNNKLDNWYVLDFGLPIEIPVSDLVINSDSVTAISVKGTQLSDNPVTTDHGELTYDATRKVITYTPTTTWAGSSAASVSFNLQYADGQNIRKGIGVIPASNILYEENFLTRAEDTTATHLPWTLDTAGSLGSMKQATHKNDVEAIFGYDDAYMNSTGSNGAWKVSGLSKESSVSKPLTAEFYGNALDVIGTCDKNTAMLMMIISNVDNPSAAKKPVLVDTRYNGGTLNQVPFAHVELESDAHYSVNIRAYYAPAIAASNTNTATTFGAVSAISDFALSGNYADQAVWSQMARDLAEDGLTLDDVEFVRFNDTATAAQTDSLAVYADLYSVQQPARPEGTNLAIDAFRVYRSSDSNDAIGEKYIASEQNIVYNNILDVVKGQIVAFTEGNTNTQIQITDYEAAGGPQNEIYLAGGQSVLFKVENAGDTIQVSLRAVTDAPAKWATSADGGTVSTISTNTEMYYTVKPDALGNVTIANRGNTLLAIGNVKLLSGAKTMSASEIDEDALRASLCAALGLSTEQPQDFQPKTFTARATTLPMLRNKRVSVLITISNDVSYVTVNGVKYTPSRYYASWQKTRLIQFGETLGKYESKAYTIIAYDANGVASAPITVNG